ADNVQGDFGPQLLLGIHLPGCPELLRDLGDPSCALKLVENLCCCQRIGGRVSGCFDERGNEPMHDHSGQLGMGLEHIRSMAAMRGNSSEIKWLIPEPWRILGG